MTLYRVLKGRVKTTDKGWIKTGGDIELSDAEAAKINKSGKRLEPASVAVAREKADAEAKAKVAKAEKDAKGGAK